MFYWYFKLFNNIKSEKEIEFARLELEELFGSIQPIQNFFDKLIEYPLSIFTSSDIRIQDFILYELPYGKIQGFFGISEDISKLKKLVKRLAYTREIYLISKRDNVLEIQKHFSDKAKNKVYQIFEKENLVCFRFITYQYFLEKSEYISKISRNEQEIDKNVEILFSHLTNNIYRIPSSSTLSVGKRLEDYFSIREEPSLYLTHYFHPYKGKFHPKMVRSLLNYIFPKDKGLVMDNFAGSGTLLVEAGLMELDSIGIEINPLSVLMCSVKCSALLLDIKILKSEIENYIKLAEIVLNEYFSKKKGQLSFNNFSKINFKEIEEKAKKLSIILKIKNYEIVEQVLILKKLLSFVQEKHISDFLLLALSGTISDIIRRKKEDFILAFSKRVKELYLRVYLFNKLNDILDIKVGNSKTYEEDTRNMKSIENESIYAILNSPPYSTALDYIKNDYPQLILLELTQSIEELNKNMIGSPRFNHNSIIISSINLPNFASEIIKNLLNNDKRSLALRTYKFFTDMYETLKEMKRVLKNESKCAIIIGNNRFKINNNYIEIPNDKVIVELALSLGFNVDKIINREVHKSSEGAIREESVIILEKGSKNG